MPTRTPCKLAFVGEAPADVEMESGVPLSGPSGGVFNRILRAADLDRRDFLITNVFDFQLEKNDVRSITAPAPRTALDAEGTRFVIGDRIILPEYRAFEQRLAGELDRAKPDVIVPLGGTATWAFTGSADLSRSRGAVTTATRGRAGVKVVPTYHPAHVIKDWRLFHVCVNDILKALRESEFPSRPPQHARREIWISPTLDDLQNFKRMYLSDPSSVISVDIETMRGQISCIGFAPDSSRAIVIPFVDSRRPSFNYWPTAAAERAALAWVRGVLSSPQSKLFQNGMFDVTLIWDKWRIPVRGYTEDTRLLHHSLYCELPKDLAFLGACYAEAPPWKLMRPWYNAEKGKSDE